jgi:1-acyl-sn-glycerol-3-phosphate acyltransferase
MTQTTSSSAKGPLALLKTRRFAPFFWTQFSGALNDNLFKTALAVLLTYAASASGAGNTSILVNLAAGLFIAPFFFFSALAGQLADKFEKSVLIRRIKLAEVAIMGGAAVAWTMNWPYVLLALLFAMGTQSTFFGPVKYSILPQHLRRREIVGGNGMVEMGTFVAILAGTMAGGMLMAMDVGRYIVAVAVAAVALIGYIISRRIPRAKAADPDIKINWHLVGETAGILRSARKDKDVFMAVMGISWFWFVGAAYLTQLPLYARDVLRCDAGIISLLLALFSIGIAVGSLLCERLSGKALEMGMVPIGTLGMSFFGFDLVRAYDAASVEALICVGQFIVMPGAWRVLLDLAMIGIFGGLYIVPLFAFIQLRTPARIRSRIIAANNVLNAVFMVASAAVAALLLGVWGVTIPHFFGWLAASNLLVALYVYYRYPFFLLRKIVWVLTRIMYRVRSNGLDRIPEKGAAVLVCNHVSYVDALFIFAASRRPVRFVMHAGYYHVPLLRGLFRVARVIPIDSGKNNPKILKQAFAEIASTLEDGGLVCIFPEGHLTRSGEIDAFRPGIERILEQNPVPVIPLALRGLWGSFFSHAGGLAMARWPKRFWSRIELVAGEIVQPQSVTADRLRSIVYRLRGASA